MHKAEVRVLFLGAVMTLMASCGYTLEFKRVKGSQEEDPMTVIRRDIRQMKADHRVAIFDLRKEHGAQLGTLQSDLTRLKNANEGLGQAVLQMKRDIQETRITLGKKNAEIDDRFTETELQRRQIHGRIDQEANRSKEASERSNQFALQEIEALRKVLAAQEAAQKKAEKAVTALERQQGEAKQSLQDQMALAQAKSAALEKLADQQGKALLEVSEQVSQKGAAVLGVSEQLSQQGKTVREFSDQVAQLVEKLVPSVNALAARLDDLEWQVNQFKRDVDVQLLNKRLSELAESIDIQRKSLEMLGNTVTSQVDKQQGLLQQTIKRLNGLEAKPSPKAPQQ